MSQHTCHLTSVEVPGLLGLLFNEFLWHLGFHEKCPSLTHYDGDDGDDSDS
jgi:hypothetical protein